LKIAQERERVSERHWWGESEWGKKRVSEKEKKKKKKRE
jgi:hypothetical protein